jgi:hypothetical protein
VPSQAAHLQYLCVSGQEKRRAKKLCQ